jgi:hypothetical protein
MFNAIKLTPESFPHIIELIGKDDTHAAWLTDLYQRYDLDQKIGQTWYIVKNYVAPGYITVYPFCALSEETVQERADHVQIADHF